MSETIRVLVVGCGNMGSSHARAYHKLDGFEIAGVVSRKPETRGKVSAELGGLPEFDSFEKGMAETKPDAVSINTYPDTHAEFALLSLRAGAHVFVEKPIAMTVKDAEAIARTSKETGKKVVVGYILRVHPAWTQFINIARTLGKPLVMRMNLNQQSSGQEWVWHKQLMSTFPPLVDCGVHYVDVMCQMTGAKPVRVHAIGVRLTDEVKPHIYNYGQLQVVFDDGSVGWYEAGWGPMMSEEAFFIKDVIGPKGCVSIIKGEPDKTGGSSDIESHAKTNRLRIHHAELDAEGRRVKNDELIDTSDEPEHQELCDREQEFFLRAIRKNLDLTSHLNDAVNSLRIVLAADRSVREGQVVTLVSPS